MLCPEHDEGRPGERAALNVNYGDVLILPDLDHFTRRLLQDALNEARRSWWLKRAEDFERAKPRPGDFNGRATIEQLRARWRWCHATAQACRNKAALIAMTADEFQAEVDALLDGEAA